MLRHLTLLIAASSLVACGSSPGGVAGAGSTPAPTVPSRPHGPTRPHLLPTIADATLPAPSSISPTAATQLDDQGIARAFQAIDLARAAIDIAIDTGRLKPRTPLALQIATGLDTARHALNSASAIQRGLQAGSYREAMDRARLALDSATRGLNAIRAN